jgi:hypothetical protein
MRFEYGLFEEVSLCCIKTYQLKNPRKALGSLRPIANFLGCIAESIKLTLHVRSDFSYLTLPLGRKEEWNEIGYKVLD